MAENTWEKPGVRAALYIAAGYLVAICVGALIWAGFTEDPGVVYTALAAIFTLLALLAAAVAVVLTWPQYNAWRRQQLATPKITVWLEYAPSQDDVPEPIGSELTLPSPLLAFVLRVVVVNDGDAPMREAMVNIVVPLSCGIKPIDPPAKVHYLSPMPSRSAELIPGEAHPVRFTVARADITPGHHVFHALISPEGPGPWPVMVDLTGDPAPALDQRTMHLQVIRTPQSGT